MKTTPTARRATPTAAAAAAALLALAVVPCATASADAAGRGADARIVVRVAAQEAIAPKWIPGPPAPTGICPDLFAAIERVEPRLRFTGLDAARSLTAMEVGLESGTLDAACALMASPRRHAVARVVGKPVYLVRHRLVARSEDPAATNAHAITSIADLVRLDALVTSQRSSVLTERLKAAGVRVDDATDDNGLNLRKMLAGHGRFAYLNELTLRHYLRSEHLEKRVRVLPVVLAEEDAWFWVSRKTDPGVGKLVGAAIDQLKASGELERIYTRWAANP